MNISFYVLIALFISISVDAQVIFEKVENVPGKLLSGSYELSLIREHHTEQVDMDEVNHTLRILRDNLGETRLSDDEIEALRPVVINKQKSKVNRLRIVKTPNFYVQFDSPNLEGIKFNNLSATDLRKGQRRSLDIDFDARTIILYSSVNRHLDFEITQSLKPDSSLRIERDIARKRIRSGEPWYRTVSNFASLPFGIQTSIQAYRIHNDNLSDFYFSTDSEGYCIEQLDYSRNNQLSTRKMWGQYQTVEGVPFKKPFIYSREKFDENGELSEVDIMQYSRIKVREDLRDMTLEEFLKDYINDSFRIMRF